ncbi:hypothetical protein BOW94_gp25 [Escherichia phage GA2A]|uniref:Uncharacterized protein n=1 Tax=Escherichia phage GA2A TaxID=1755695 RepID=A0A1B0TR48_9CAUD|nr:hypothetical protein BOW94_gp25 [Escherichia phage GA2A]ALP47790.1 hypothetical protein GA2A_23 [Escherichia phage GA2A]
MLRKLKARYHRFMYKWWSDESTCLSNILGDQRFNSKAWKKANRKFMYHFLRTDF